MQGGSQSRNQPGVAISPEAQDPFPCFLSLGGNEFFATVRLSSHVLTGQSQTGLNS